MRESPALFQSPYQLPFQSPFQLPCKIHLVQPANSQQIPLESQFQKYYPPKTQVFHPNIILYTYWYSSYQSRVHPHNQFHEILLKLVDFSEKVQTDSVSIHHVREANLNISWTRREASSMIDKDWEVAYDQFVFAGNKNYTGYRPQKAGETTFTVDKQTGALTSLNLNGKELLATPLTLSLYRPATDNDNRDKNGARLWRDAGLDCLTQKVVSLRESKTSTTARVEILNAKTQRVGIADFVYSLDRNGALKVHTTFQPDTTIVKSMARLGLTFRVSNAYDQVSYLGRGDNETYIDRNQSGKIGVYQTTPERMFHYYVAPQSTGNRTDVRWVKLADTSGEGIFVESDRAFQFSIIPFSDVLLEKARHINELERDGLLTVHLDAEQAGVGTATCGPGVLPQYLVPLKKQSFEFTLYPVK